MDLFLVRHGQPAWSTPDRLALNDPGLTELGLEQAARVAHRLASLTKVDNLWVSSMARALETADLIEAQIEPDREVFDWLQEINNPPEWEGTPVEEIDRHFETINLRSMDEMWEGLGPGGESFREFHERVVQGLRETLDSHGVHPIDDGNNLWNVDSPDQRVVIVGHAGANAVILGDLLGLDPVPWEWERFRQPHTGVSRITTLRIADGWAFSLRQLGSVSHLHPGMVTT